MNDQTDHVQQTLLPPDVVELTLRVALVNSSDHVQWQLEARCPTDDTLIAMESSPHAPLGALDTTLTEACRRFVRLVREHAWTL